MKRVGVVLASSLLLFVASLALSGCSGLECGEGTVEYDGECVQTGFVADCESGQIRDGDDCVDPENLCGQGTEYRAGRGACMPEFDELSCGEGAEQDGDRCVAPEPVECGENTHELDPWTNECVPRGLVCQGGTVFTVVDDEGVCLPSDEVCGDDTVFVEQTHLCMPAYDCRPGDVVIDGYCMPEAMELADDIEYEATGNTNPDLGGEAVEVDVGDAGDMAVFGGTIGAPEDLNDDGNLDQSIDVYEFEAQEGDWLEISVQSLGIPNPAFIVLSEDGTEERVSPLTGYPDKMRQVTITEDGTYHLAVLPEPALRGTEAAVGDSGWDYVGTLELMETPEAEEHDVTQESVEESLGRLDDNFFFVDGFDEGAEVQFNWRVTPTHAEPVVTVWASEDEFLGEYRGSSFALEVPPSGEFYVVFDWDVAYGTAGLDYEVWAQELVSIPPGEEVSYTFSADEGDVLYVSHDNDWPDPMDLVVTDEEDDVVLEEMSLDAGHFSRYIGLEEGQYTATFENSTIYTVESFIAHIDVGVQKDILSLGATYSGSSNEVDYDEQAYYFVEFNDKRYLELMLTHAGGSGWGRIFVYGVGDEQLERTYDYVSSDDSELSTIVEFEAGRPYIIRIGNDFIPMSAISYPFDFELNFAGVDSLDDGDDTSLTVSAEDGDVLEIEQDNASGATMSVEVTDDEGDSVVTDSLDAGERLYHYGVEEGDYTVTFENDSGGLVFNLEADARAVSPIEAESFGADVGDAVRVRQDNDEDAEVKVVITAEGGDVAAFGVLDESEALYVDVDADGEYTVSYFQPGMPTADQEVEGIDFAIDFFQATTLVTFDVEEGDVVEVDRDSVFTAEEVELELVDADTDDVYAAEALAYNGFMRYIGVEQTGQRSLVAYDYGSGELEDYDLGYEVITPEVVNDKSETYEGEANDAEVAEQSFYLVEFDETMTYDVTLTKTAGLFGFGRLFIYARGDDQLKRMEDHVGGSNDDTNAITFEFEAETPYIIRVGNDLSGTVGDTFEYELTFE